MGVLLQLTACLTFLATASMAQSGDLESSVPLAEDDECLEATPGTANRSCAVTAMQLRAAKAPPGSCRVYQCNTFEHGRPCHCNSKCYKYNNCCQDYESFCVRHEGKPPAPPPPMPPPPPKRSPAGPSCAVYQCNSYEKNRPCQCNSKCAKYGNCCQDYDSICKSPAKIPAGKRLPSKPTPPPPPPHYAPPGYDSTGRCVAFKCGTHKVNRTCQCDPGCKKHGTCCKDYLSQCMWEQESMVEPPENFEKSLQGLGTSFKCSSKLNFGNVTKAQQKGMTLDDHTWMECPDTIPAFFPNTDTNVKSIRLAKAWDREWPAEKRLPSWMALKRFVKANDVKVFVGTEVTCNEKLDAESWTWTKELLKMLGPKYVMGLTVGDELELLGIFGKPRKFAPVSPECIEKLWKGGRAWTYFKSVVKEFDAMGFKSVPVTSVMGGHSLAGKPFLDTNKSMVTSFLKNATKHYGKRFVFTFNIYPYYDPDLPLDADWETCYEAVNAAAGWGPRGFMPGILYLLRERVRSIAPDNKIWLGETGWSSPHVPFLGTDMAKCKDWSAKETLRQYYEGFLKWDMTGIDHVFYLTMRDAQKFGTPSYFGLVDQCCSDTCKLQ